MTNHEGQQLGAYRLIRLLGRGTFADVYLGQHIHLNIEVAVKTLHERLGRTDVNNFLTEARTIANLRHPHIVRVLDFGVEETAPFLVMDYAPHGNLRQIHQRGTQPSLATIISYVQQVADALQYVHQQQLIHRDIKPENLLLGYDHEILLSDFGIAILDQHSHSHPGPDTAGTIAYMAPEQFQAQPVFASDQYALGVVVYEWLCGDRPFHGSFSEIALKHTLASPPSMRERVPTIPLAVERVVFKALAKDPQQRFAHVQDFAAALEEASTAGSSEQTFLTHTLEHTAEVEQRSRRTLPLGTVTLLFADIVGSTQLLQQLGNRYADILIACRHLLHAAFQQWHGYEVDTQAEAFLCAFARATDAISAAATAQRSMGDYPWPEGLEVRMRIGLHTGEPEPSSDGYVGPDVLIAARIGGAAHGGQVLLSRTTQQLIEHTLPEGVSLRDLGLYHLKDVRDPKRIFQAVMTGLPADFPPLRTHDVRLNNLSVQLTSLIGREQEVTQVCALLQQPAVRLVTLTGMGGIGKTRLGLQVATELLATFADGTYFVSLATVTDPVMVIPTVAHLLGLEHMPIGQLLPTEHMEYLKAFLHEKHLLLLLDNFEQVLSAAPGLAELLTTCPHLKILVTSRAALHIQGEHEFLVPPLALPRRAQLSENDDLSLYPAVALFLERALAIKPDLAITKANMQAIAAICVHLDGLPLAIELAAARSKLFPPRALLQRMTHRLDVLTRGVQGVPARQQTLRNMIAWSYNLLNASEQRLFQWLAVFVGGSTLEAVEYFSSVFAAEAAQALDGVAALIDNNLLLQIERDGEEPRFMMLEMIREYGLEVLAASGEEERTRDAHRAYYLALAEKARPELAGPLQSMWLDRLERDHANLRAALQWSLAQGQVKHDMTIALRLGVALLNFWTVRGPYSEGRHFLDQALAASTEVEAALQARAYFTTANIAFIQSDYDRAEELCQQSLKLYRELEDRSGIAYALYLLAWVSRENIKIEVAMVEEALQLFQELGNREYVAWSIYTLAYLACLQGEYSQAFSLVEEGLGRHKVAENKRGIAFSRIQWARIHFDSLGDLASAQALLAESFASFKELDDKVGLGYSHALGGQLALAQGDATQARLLIEQGLVLYRELGARQGIAESLCRLARIVASQGDNLTASSFYEESLTIARVTNKKELIAFCLEGWAEVAASQGKLVWAAQLWGTAEVLREDVGIPIPLVDRAHHARQIDNLRTRLDEKAFVAAWTRGRTMTLEQALATQGQEQEEASTRTAPAYPAGLTAREVGVLHLVAKGLTNAEIAQELKLSEKTVAHHLTHIFNKTNCENRAAAAAFAIRSGLV